VRFSKNHHFSSPTAHYWVRSRSTKTKGGCWCIRLFLYLKDWQRPASWSRGLLSLEPDPLGNAYARHQRPHFVRANTKAQEKPLFSRDSAKIVIPESSFSHER
jgi:hypothetical protein